MRPYIATIAAAAALLAGFSVVGAGGTAAAAAVGWCDGVKWVQHNSLYGTKQPYHKATGSTTCYLERGSYGSAVNALQLALKYCNWAPNLVADSDFGAITEERLKYAQQRRGVLADGSYGPNTRAALKWPVFHNNGLRTDTCVFVS
ncbi:peptidoglycan-binding domain-containing protein [Actinosynnema sp. NPDC002837]